MADMRRERQSDGEVEATDSIDIGREEVSAGAPGIG